MPSLALLGIAIPSYNRPDLLARLLDSIDASLPISVSDNGAFLDEAFHARYPQVRFITQQAVVTMWQNWNRAARAVEAEWIVLPGDDDLYNRGAFDTIEHALRLHPTADIVFFGHDLIDEHDRVIETWQPEAAVLAAPNGFERVRLGVPARPPGIVVRKAVFDRLGGFCEDFHGTASDNDFYQRVAMLGTSVFVPDVVCAYRVWTSAGTTLTIATRSWLDDIDLWTRRMQEFAARQGGCAYPPGLRDDVYMANLRAGIHALKKRAGGYAAAWRHVAAARYPLRAHPLSHLKLLVQLLLPVRP